MAHCLERPDAPEHSDQAAALRGEIIARHRPRYVRGGVVYDPLQSSATYTSRAIRTETAGASNQLPGDRDDQLASSLSLPPRPPRDH